MASLPVNGRDINEVSNKVFNGGGAKFKNGDTLFARITPCLENGKTAKVENLPVDCIAHGSTEFIVLSAKSKDDEDFVYYLARSPDFRNYAISRMEGTSGRQRVSWQALAEFNLRLPEKSKRKKIGEILKSLDDKIHLNNQINQTLESIAQALFKSWFVDFDPVRAKIAAKQEGKDSELAAMCIISGKSEDEIQQMPEGDFAELQATAALFPEEFVVSELGEVPKGWEVSTVGEQVQAVGGGTPSTKNADFWDNGIHYWTTPKDLSNLTDKILLNTERKLTDTGLKKISSGLLPKNTVLMSSRAPVGYLALAKIEVAINQGYIAILPNTKYSAEYLIQWCEANMAEIKGRASGTTFLEISKKNFKEINFICSDEKVVTVYTKTAKTLYDEISLKAEENQILINLRDTLLPKLLSGELEVLT
ncbi:restriction endonuclease subunit S [Acinetobacter bereziniae]|nr:restriction endonuclease subunit S [Acinetobacter bereziniae]